MIVQKINLASSISPYTNSMRKVSVLRQGYCMNREVSLVILPNIFLHRDTQEKKGWYFSCTLGVNGLHNWYQGLPPEYPKGFNSLGTPEHTCNLFGVL